MSTAERTLPNEYDLFFVEDSFGSTPFQVARAGITSSFLRTIVNTCSKMLAGDGSLMPQQVAGKVFGRLLKPGRISLSTQPLSPALQGYFDYCIERLFARAEYRVLAEALGRACGELTWFRAPAGPFASMNFEGSNSHAILIGPGGLEERTDARIGIAMLTPYMRMPDHKLDCPRAYLALTDFEFSTESTGWTRAETGTVCFAPAGELVAYRCTTAPLLTMWCDVPLPAHSPRGNYERSTGRTARKHGV